MSWARVGRGGHWHARRWPGCWSWRAASAPCGTSLGPLQNLAGCNFAKQTITGSLALADSDLSGANLNKVTVSGQGALLGSNLAGANLNGATVSGLDALINAELARANLNTVDITASAVGVGADLSGANLSGATIAGLGDLTGANLTGTNLHGATVSGIGAFTGANLTRANLAGVATSGLDAFFDATWSDTICPDGTNSNVNGGSCAGHLNDPLSVASSAGVVGGPAPVPLRELQLASPNVTWQDGPTPAGTPTSNPGYNNTCASYPAGSPEPSTMSLSANGSGDGLISFDPGSQGPPAVFISNLAPVEQAGTTQLQFTLSGSEPLGSGTSSFSDTFTGYGTSFSGTLTEVLITVAGSCTWTTPVTLTFAGSGLTLATHPAVPLPPGTEVAGGGGLPAIGAYCNSLGYSGPNAISQTLIVGGSSIEAWFCGSGPGGSETAVAPLNLSAACAWEYPGTVAFNPDPAGPLGFECLSTAATPVGPGYYETDNGISELAFGGGDGAGGLPDFVYTDQSGNLTAFGGGDGSSGLPDLVYSAGDGSSVIYSSPSGDFEVAESGSLATGGAI